MEMPNLTCSVWETSLENQCEVCNQTIDTFNVTCFLTAMIGPQRVSKIMNMFR